MLIRFAFNDYESFKFTNSLLGQVYACTEDGPDTEKAKTEKASK